MNRNKLSLTLGNNIRSMRGLHDWTQRFIADRIYISVAAYSKIETGVTDVNLSRLEQIARIFGVHIARLFTSEPLAPTIFVSEQNRLEKAIEDREHEILTLQRKLIQLYELLGKAAKR